MDDGRWIAVIVYRRNVDRTCDWLYLAKRCDEDSMTGVMQALCGALLWRVLRWNYFEVGLLLQRIVNITHMT